MKKILLIEDDPITIELYGDVLERAGFDIEILSVGNAAFAALDEIKEGKKERPDLILLDLILPDMNGIEVLKRAKEKEELKSIPIFVLTNYTDPDTEKESWKLGVEEYIVKTSRTPSQLIKTIKERFERK